MHAPACLNASVLAVGGRVVPKSTGKKCSRTVVARSSSSGVPSSGLARTSALRSQGGALQVKRGRICLVKASGEADDASEDGEQQQVLIPRDNLDKRCVVVY